MSEPDDGIRPGEHELTDRRAPVVPPAPKQLILGQLDGREIQRAGSDAFKLLFRATVAVLVLQLVYFAGLEGTAPPPERSGRGMPGRDFWHFVMGIPVLWLVGVFGVVLSIVGVVGGRGRRLRFLWLLVAHLALSVGLTLAVDPVYALRHGVRPGRLP